MVWQGSLLSFTLASVQVMDRWYRGVESSYASLIVVTALGLRYV